MPELLVAMPAYNEELNIGAFLGKLLSLKLPVDFDILVVDDGSHDQTAAVAREYGVKIVSHIFNIGYGCALQTAYKYATLHNYNYLIQIDADGQHDIQNVATIYRSLISDQKPDLVIGSRFLSAENRLKTTFAKRTAIGFFRLAIRIFTGNKITDPTSGLQGMNRKTFSHIAGFQNFFNDFPDANMIIQMMLNDFNVCEIGAVMHPRLSGKGMHNSKLESFSYVTIMTISVLVIVLREKVFHRKKKTSA